MCVNCLSIHKTYRPTGNKTALNLCYYIKELNFVLETDRPIKLCYIHIEYIDKGVRASQRRMKHG